MIPYDIDPTLHAAEPEPPQLDDGFSPPPHEEPAPVAQARSSDGQPQEAVLGDISPF
jgi:hypothetical protein